VATTPVNDAADAAAARLKDGLNDLLARMEIPGCASGVASIVLLRPGVDHECDKAVCNLSRDDLNRSPAPGVERQLGLALYNRGVDAAERFILSAEHTEQDIDDTVDAVGSALGELREEGII
jgi:glutamate-1-semialdehyde aminotransferase